MDSAADSSLSILELNQTDSVKHGGSSWSFLREATPEASPYPVT